jgi:ubiquitin carboxyl-terminal hydrolase 7
MTAQQRYHLHGYFIINFSVLVHSGDLNAGHYFSFIRPEKGGNWFKFDDDRVIPATDYEVYDENFGGDNIPLFGPHMASTKAKMIKKLTNAYMLVYIREYDLDEILKPITDADIPDHLRISKLKLGKRFEEEKRQTEAIKKEQEEGHIYLTVKILSSDNLSNYRGIDLCDDTTVFPTLKLRKDLTVKEFKVYLYV